MVALFPPVLASGGKTVEFGSADVGDSLGYLESDGLAASQPFYMGYEPSRRESEFPRSLRDRLDQKAGFVSCDKDSLLDPVVELKLRW